MDLIVEFFRHNSVMNMRLLDACQELDTDQLGVTVVGTYGGIGDTLVHIANSQLGYVPRFVAATRPDPLPHDPFPGFPVLAERFSLGNGLLEQAAERAGEDHSITVSGDDPPGTWRMPASLILVQAVNHSTEHRTQVAAILTQLGVEPPAMDGWAYFSLSGHMTEV